MRFKREQRSDTIGDVLSAGAESHEYVPVNGSIETFTPSFDENAVG